MLSHPSPDLALFVSRVETRDRLRAAEDRRIARELRRAAREARRVARITATTAPSAARPAGRRGWPFPHRKTSTA